jgi:hypothetical protein
MDNFIICDISQSYDLGDTITEIGNSSRIYSFWRDMSAIDMRFYTLDELGSEKGGILGHKKKRNKL